MQLRIGCPEIQKIVKIFDLTALERHVNLREINKKG